MTTTVKTFLDSLTEEDYKGSETKRSIKSKAKGFINSGEYEDYETYEGYVIHESLCCLVYDAI